MKLSGRVQDEAFSQLELNICGSSVRALSQHVCVFGLCGGMVVCAPFKGRGKLPSLPSALYPNTRWCLFRRSNEY